MIPRCKLLEHLLIWSTMAEETTPLVSQDTSLTPLYVGTSDNDNFYSESTIFFLRNFTKIVVKDI